MRRPLPTTAPLIPWAIVAALLLLIPSPAHSDPPPQADEGRDYHSCMVVAMQGGITCNFFLAYRPGDADPPWELHHPSLWDDEETYLEREPAKLALTPLDADYDPDELTPPLTEYHLLDDRLFYAVHADLLEVDTDRGEVVRRVRFPAPIHDIAATDEETLDVTLRVTPERPASEVTEVVFHFDPDGPEPAQVLWSGTWEFFAAERNADWLVADLSEGESDEAIERLDQARSTDPTNPYYAYELGKWHRIAGDDGAAMEAFADAADSPGAPWTDLLAISSKLEAAGAPDAADRAFRMGVGRIHQIVPGATSQLISALRIWMALHRPTPPD